MSTLHEILASCPHCKVEGALLELYDPGLSKSRQSSLANVAVESSCRFCGYTAAFGETTQEGKRFESVFEVMEALDTWAAREGDEDVRRFTAANFQGLSPEEVSDKLLSGEPIETGFDVIAWLFPNSGATTATGSPGSPIAPPKPEIRFTRTLDQRTVINTTRPDPRTPGRALVTMMLADGQIKPSENRFIESWLTAHKLPLPPKDEWRIWRPLELAPPPDAAATLAAMLQTALADSDLDASEVRVLREYARAWQVPLEERKLAPRRGLARIVYILGNWVG